MGTCTSKSKIDNIIILHKLILDGNAKLLGIALSSIKHDIYEINGMSLYHTWVLSVLFDKYKTHKDIEAMYNVLRVYHYSIGDITSPSTGNKDVIIYTSESNKFMAFIDKHDNITPGFNHDSYIDVQERTRYKLSKLTPLMFAINIKICNPEYPDLDFVIELLSRLELEHNKRLKRIREQKRRQAQLTAQSYACS